LLPTVQQSDIHIPAFFFESHYAICIIYYLPIVWTERYAAHCSAVKIIGASGAQHWGPPGREDP